ncbi:hypothetical protein BC829DRAFT_301601 [Chytridium lagenaria]|nr:hypothetical protein BC829DRAFT_301601 [Chytridium lagenaria]
MQIPFPTGASPYGFHIFQEQGVAYVADDSGANAGVNRFQFVNGAWTKVGIVYPTACRAITGAIDGDKFVLYVTTAANAVVAVTDPITYTSGAATVRTVISASTNTAFRGIAIAPSGGIVVPPSPTATTVVPPITSTATVIVPTSTDLATTTTTTGTTVSPLPTATVVPPPTGCATTVQQVQGDTWRSKYANACNIEGIITNIRRAKDGLFIQAPSDATLPLPTVSSSTLEPQPLLRLW